MLNFKIFLGFLIVLFSFCSHAFNWKKCREVFFAGGNGVGIFMSTTSYVSSTSECSAIGSVENQKKLFIVHNLDMLKSDSARGEGEYINAYAYLLGCRGSYKNQVPIKFQKNFKEIFGSESIKNSEEVYGSIESIFRRDEDFRKGCDAV